MKGQYDSDCILLIRICKKILKNKTQKYHVMKIVENFVEGKFCEFVAVLSFWDTYRRARFEGCFGSSADNMVHSVQKVNSVL